MKVAVAVNVHKEPLALISACLKGALHLGTPKAFIDGVNRPDVMALCDLLGVNCDRRPISCGNNQLWYRWWGDLLDYFIASGADLCFKIDPDTRVIRSPASFPEADYFGTIEAMPWGRFVQGGCTGLSRRAVLMMAEYLDKGKDGEAPWFTHAFGDPAVYIDDQKIGVLMAWLGIDPSPWGECLSRWRDPVTAREAASFAIVHPFQIFA